MGLDDDIKKYKSIINNNNSSSNSIGSNIGSSESSNYCYENLLLKSNLPDNEDSNNNNNNNNDNNNNNIVEESKLPPSIKYIMFSEIGERYSYYSFRSILVNYCIEFMGYSNSTSSVIGHSLSAGIYSFTLIGAYIADGKIGKFKTILYFNIIYCIGSIVFAITSIPKVIGSTPGNRSPVGLIIGLVLIAIGNGGIKPVVSAFCGDQFTPNQNKSLSSLFQLLFWCANFGSLFSCILSPILRTNVGYWCAFSIPSFILLSSLIIFIIGHPLYIKIKPKGELLSIMFGVVICGIKESIKSSIKTSSSLNSNRYYVDSWVDRAQVKYNSNTVLQVKLVLRVLLLFAPLIISWALFDQISTRFIIQSNQLNRRLGSITIDSEIIGVVNPLFVIILIPIFEFLIVGPLKKRNIIITPLKKIGCGMLLSSIAFFIAGLLQISINNHPKNTIHFALQIPQYILLTISEILIFISGLEVAYSNSPKSMKSIIMAGWFTTIALGSLLDAFIIGLIKVDDYILDFIFGSIMFIFLIIFIFISINFKSVNQDYIEPLDNNNNYNNNNNNNNNNYLRDNNNNKIDNNQPIEMIDYLNHNNNNSSTSTSINNNH